MGRFRVRYGAKFDGRALVGIGYYNNSATKKANLLLGPVMGLEHLENNMHEVKQNT